MLFEMAQRHGIGGLAAEEQPGEKLVLGEAVWHRLPEPVIQLVAAMRGESVDAPIWPAFLKDQLGANEAARRQRLERRVDLAAAGVPIGGERAVEGALDIVARHGVRAQQAQEDVAQRVPARLTLACVHRRLYLRLHHHPLLYPFRTISGS